MPLHMRLPKLRGFRNPFRVEYQVVNLDRIGELFPEGGEVSVADLVAKGAVRDGRPVKVLGTGEVVVRLQVSAHAFSGVGAAEDRGGRRHGDHRLTPGACAYRDGPGRRCVRARPRSPGRRDGRRPEGSRPGAGRGVRVGPSGSVPVPPQSPAPTRPHDHRGHSIDLIDVGPPLGGAQEDPCYPRSPGRSERPTCGASCSSPWGSWPSSGSGPSSPCRASATRRPDLHRQRRQPPAGSRSSTSSAAARCSSCRCSPWGSCPTSRRASSSSCSPWSSHGSRP